MPNVPSNNGLTQNISGTYIRAFFVLLSLDHGGICFCHPVIACFRDLESSNLNNLVLIPSCLARTRRSAASPGEIGNPRGISDCRLV
jgi:hypothetical protein